MINNLKSYLIQNLLTYFLFDFGLQLKQYMFSTDFPEHPNIPRMCFSVYQTFEINFVDEENSKKIIAM